MHSNAITNWDVACSWKINEYIHELYHQLRLMFCHSQRRLECFCFRTTQLNRYIYLDFTKWANLVFYQFCCFVVFTIENTRYGDFFSTNIWTCLFLNLLWTSSTHRRLQLVQNCVVCRVAYIFSLNSQGRFYGFCCVFFCFCVILD